MTNDKDKYATLNLSANGNTTGNTKNGNTKSYAQVESLVLPPLAVLPNSCGLKPKMVAPAIRMGTATIGSLNLDRAGGRVSDNA